MVSDEAAAIVAAELIILTDRVNELVLHINKLVIAHNMQVRLLESLLEALQEQELIDVKKPQLNS